MPWKGQKLASFCYLHCDKAPDWGKCQAAHDSRKGKKTLWAQLTNGTKGKVPTKGWKWRGVEGPLDALKSPTYKWLGPRAADCRQNPISISLGWPGKDISTTELKWELPFQAGKGPVPRLTSAAPPKPGKESIWQSGHSQYWGHLWLEVQILLQSEWQRVERRAVSMSKTWLPVASGFSRVKGIQSVVGFHTRSNQVRHDKKMGVNCFSGPLTRESF